jgi:CMP-N-acetylneuraminic acid synthetase
MYIIGIIPARAGSKEIPRKNIIDLKGHPLIYYTIKSANKSNLDEIIVSTEDKEIKEISESLGARVIDRPIEFAQDTSPTEDAIRHVLENVECDGFVLLQCTSPLRSYIDINDAIELLESGYDTVVSVSDFYGDVFEGDKPLTIDHKKPRRRQDINQVIVTGVLYGANTEYFLETGNLIGENNTFLKIPKERSFDIDDMIDFKIVELFIGDYNDDL